MRIGDVDLRVGTGPAGSPELRVKVADETARLDDREAQQLRDAIDEYLNGGRI